VFQVASTEENAFSTEDVRLLELLLGHTGEAVHRIRLQERLKEQALRDPLTGVYNRRYFNQVIEQEIPRSKRYDHPIGFLMIDVNHFKEINDRYGHQVGDEVLQEVAKLLEGQVRGSDVVVRYGGDEFLLLLIETNGETKSVKQRILEEVARQNETNPVFDFPVTFSIGIAHWKPDGPRTVSEVLNKADMLMYEEKRLQKGRT
jgi:diguanylate cyclase (GGDEF)-like protein